VSLAIRSAAPEDAAFIRAVHAAAFPSAAEADLVEALEREGDAVISLVAERDGAVAGHILLSRMTVSGDGHAYRALGLGPVAVLSGARRQGLGGALVRASLEMSAASGEELVFVLGDPAYYGRFGFSAACAAPFASPYAGPHLMALRLLDDVALPRSGKAEYARAFAELDGG
jgi:putative acetyltransferase